MKHLPHSPCNEINNFAITKDGQIWIFYKYLVPKVWLDPDKWMEYLAISS